MHAVSLRHHLGLCGKRIFRIRGAPASRHSQVWPPRPALLGINQHPRRPRDPRSSRSDPLVVVIPEGSGSLETDYTVSTHTSVPRAVTTLEARPHSAAKMETNMAQPVAGS
ncbi:hypothetical protein CORC01_03476 [Colletotrichum orchidophilum]|uniref:Uncharacterized protein n=1 Tax=Colletotrichum orchidophilum TaxID=1209926 RepID=A0A1G4BIA6_9PEZI|nr:uncharacterized protein CORC01_03476 [Colletotrichum orchidophilum]OHF01162.1 hypothetical protein CORC01_03476 [Colletotrichum orchidophilum]